jgi:hypothetical protein
LYYNLPNGKTVYLTIEEYLDLTDLDIQYLISLDYGESILNPFKGSAVEKPESSKQYDFQYLEQDDEIDINNIPSDDTSFDDLIDLTDSMDI